MAAMRGAVHDAINSIEPKHETYRSLVEAPAGAFTDAAVATAARGVLAALVPSQKAELNATLAESLAKVNDARSIAGGIEVGRTATERMLAWRAKDNLDAKAEDKPTPSRPTGHDAQLLKPLRPWPTPMKFAFVGPTFN
jgi:hypothetical protein